MVYIEYNFVEKNILKGKNIKMKKLDCWHSDLSFCYR